MVPTCAFNASTSAGGGNRRGRGLDVGKILVLGALKPAMSSQIFGAAVVSPLSLPAGNKLLDIELLGIRLQRLQGVSTAAASKGSSPLATFAKPPTIFPRSFIRACRSRIGSAKAGRTGEGEH